MKDIAQLPQSIENILVTTRAEQPTLFLAYVIALRKQQWPLRAIATPFDVSRVSAKNWETKALNDPQAVKLSETLNIPPIPLSVRGAGVRAKKIPRDIPLEDRQRIAELSLLARKVRRWTPDDSPEKRASHEFEDLINKYVVERKVPASVFARYAGVTRRAITQRVDRMV